MPNDSLQSKIIDLVNAQRLKSVDMNRVVAIGNYGVNADGEVVYDNLHKRGLSQNGSGFVISYTAKMCEFLRKCAAGSHVRLFVYLAHNQGYGDNGVFGYRCDRKYLMTLLSIDRKTLYNALKYLQDNVLVLETRIDGQSEFMVNPNYVTVGRDKRARMTEWNNRWIEHWKQVHSAQPSQSTTMQTKGIDSDDAISKNPVLTVDCGTNVAGECVPVTVAGPQQ